jgi:hypothetical protein
MRDADGSREERPVTAARGLCACGREAVDVISVASDDGLLLVRVCAECAEDPAGGEQRELFGGFERRPLTAMPARDDLQQRLPLDARDVEEGAA